MSAWTPTELTELLKVIFLGLGALCMPLATAYIMITASRVKRAEASSLKNAESIRAVGVNVDRLEKNTNSISERNEAIAKKLGITEGVAQERASVQAHAAGTAPKIAIAPLTAPLPLPVADERTAVAAERTATAAEGSAKATERVADAAEEASKKT